MSDLGVFRGGVAVITGAGSGIGEGMARTAAKAGATVVLADISLERAEKVAGEIRAAGGAAHALRVDTADASSVDALAREVHARFGDVRLLLNNAGIETIGLAWELSAAAWQRIVDINVLGPIHGVRAFAPRMLAAKQRAFIANTASVGAFGMMPAQNPYVMSKHAVLSFTEGLRMEMELVGAPVSVSVITPGPVATRIFRDGHIAGEGAAQHQLQMEAMVSAGISGLEAGERILRGIASGEFWVSTHPEMTLAMAKQRAEHLASLSTPVITPPLRALLGPDK
ncbi:MAG: SDR family NAD(P)-dependent oxidoreductase [Deltaproteobacteria bacterium]|nr:SDR family NAD(P)-dependent oxidoreductase [Deltaproteobacteria bacterium]